MIKPLKILLAERDKDIATITKNYLISQGYSIVLCLDGDETLQHFRKERFDFVLLGIDLPVISSYDLVREIKSRHIDVPVICLGTNVHQEVIERVFRAGADDFLSRPISMEELGLRIEAIGLRTKTNEKKPHFFTFGPYTLDTLHHIIFIGNHTKHLSTKELELLYLLIQYKNRVVERSFALKHIWNRENYFNARNMDVYVGRLRKILRYDPSIYIENVHGIGYRLVMLHY